MKATEQYSQCSSDFYYVVQRGSNLKSVDEIPKSDHSKESY